MKSSIEDLIDGLKSEARLEAIDEVKTSSEIYFSHPGWDDENPPNEFTDFLRQSKFGLYIPCDESNEGKVEISLLGLVKEITNNTDTTGDEEFAAAAFEEAAKVLRILADLRLNPEKLLAEIPEKTTSMEEIHAKWPGGCNPTQEEIESFLRENGPFHENKENRLFTLTLVDPPFIAKMRSLGLIVSTIDPKSDSFFDYVVCLHDRSKQKPETERSLTT